MRTHASVTIRAPREAVWGAVTDIANAAGRIKGIEKVEVLERPANGFVGTRWRETRTMFGKEATEVMWITDASEGRFYDTRAESHGSVYTTRVAVEEVAEGTRVTMDFGAEPQTVGAKVVSFLLAPVMKGSVRKALQKDLEDIKASLESEAPRG
jgi:carbon monoxide dehydrogenase subunit G